jgi:nitroreductase
MSFVSQYSYNIHTTMIKEAVTQFPVLDLIKKRWSARSFSPKAIAPEDVKTILEAASWAASANNEQPWEYIYAHKGTAGFDTIWNCLMPGNQPWNKKAAVLIVAIARKTLAANGNPNTYAEHDLGMANAHLLLQASAMGIYSHPMAGIDKAKLVESLKLIENQYPACIIALGYLDDAEKLEEPYKERELTPRTRKPLSEFVKEL